MEVLSRWLKQEWVLVAFMVIVLFVSGGIGCSFIKTVSPVSGRAVTGDQLTVEATLYQREMNKEISAIQAEIQVLESRYSIRMAEFEQVAGDFNAAYATLEEKKAGLQKIWSDTLVTVSDFVPAPWQGAFGLLGGLGATLFGIGYRRKELQLQKNNRLLGRGPRGESPQTS